MTKDQKKAKVQIQMNTTISFEVGDKVRIVGTGDKVFDNEVVPHLHTYLEKPTSELSIPAIYGNRFTGEGATAIQLAQAYPQLWSKDGTVKATVISKFEHDCFFESYLLEVIEG